MVYGEGAVSGRAQHRDVVAELGVIRPGALMEAVFWFCLIAVFLFH